jgi:hypothetical protein
VCAMRRRISSRCGGCWASSERSPGAAPQCFAQITRLAFNIAVMSASAARHSLMTSARRAFLLPLTGRDAGMGAAADHVVLGMARPHV